MDGFSPAWLVTNEASGSNAARAIEALEACCGQHGVILAGRTQFPDDDLPDPATLDRHGARLVVVFTGDGTINALLGRLSGWGGAVMVLPGGTMNLLYHRLHGERTVEEAMAALAAGNVSLVRPGIIRCPEGDSYAGVLAGPGTSWGEVREAMRETAVADLAVNAVKAVEETLGGEWIVCAEPKLGRPEGYPLINLTPTDEAIEIEAYYAESAGEYLEQAWALLKRNFREGPHDRLGCVPAVRLAAPGGRPFGVLLDGERVRSAPEVEFRLVQSEVDLVATEINGA